MKKIALKLAIILAMAFAPLFAAANECEPCEIGEADCGGDPGGDSMAVELCE